MILDSVLDRIGQTPLVRADRLAKEYGFKCNLLMKCEYFNAGGSVKDRIAKRMVEQAERDGRLIPGKSVVIEPTSGNTGIGLALQCAVRGYRCIICMPEKMSAEKQIVLLSLGAEVIRTPNDAEHDDPRSHIQVARKLTNEIPHAVMLDQYANIHNPQAHYEGTAVEIIEDIRESYIQSSSSHRRKRSSTIDRLLNGSSHLEGLPTTVNGDRNGDSTETSASSQGRRRSGTIDKLLNGSSHLEGLPTTINGGGRNASSSKHANGAHGSPSTDAGTCGEATSSQGRPSSGRVDLLVAGAGTGGSISGLAKRLKEEYGSPSRPDDFEGCRVLGVDPIGSILAVPENLNILPGGAKTAFYAVEGIGYEFIPQVLDRDLIDDWVKVEDDRAFEVARQLIRTEALLIGGSSGAAVAGALAYLTETENGKAIAQDPNANVVVIMPDSIRNYITKPWLKPSEKKPLPMSAPAPSQPVL